MSTKHIEMFVFLQGRDVTCWRCSLPWICSPLCWLLLCNSLPFSEFDSSCALYMGFIFQSKMSLGLQVPSVLVGGQLSDSSMEISQGTLLMLLPKCKVFGDFSWPQGGRSYVLWKALAVAALTSLVRVISGRPVSSKLTHWDLTSSPLTEQPFSVKCQWKWDAGIRDDWVSENILLLTTADMLEWEWVAGVCLVKSGLL